MNKDKVYIMGLLNSIKRKEGKAYHNSLVRASLATRFDDDRFLEPQLNDELLEEAGIE